MSTKLRIIQGYFAELKGIDPATFPPERLEAFAEELKNRLLKDTRSAMPQDVLIQAARKILHAVLIDDKTFSVEEKYALMNQNAYAIILPKASPAGTYSMQVHRHYRGSQTSTSFPLPNVPRDTKINNIHAEQLIARLLFKVLGIRTASTYTFGISKLCCGTCKNYLDEYPVRFRGTHMQLYQGVVNLDRGSVEPASSARRATTHQWRSPGDTPDHPTAASRCLSLDPSEAGLVCSRLVFGAESLGSGQTFFSPAMHDSEDAAAKSALDLLSIEKGASD